MNNINEYLQEIADADCILVGIGNDFKLADDNEENLIDIYNKLADILKGKNYYFISECEDDVITKCNINRDKVVLPLRNADTNIDEEWDRYLMWLSCTLNRKLLVLELGVSLMSPQLIRWPFEKTVMLNNKAKLIRVNSLVPNVPSEIGEKAESINKNAIDFCS